MLVLNCTEAAWRVFIQGGGNERHEEERERESIRMLIYRCASLTCAVEKCLQLGSLFCGLGEASFL